MKQKFIWVFVFYSISLNADQFTFLFYNDFFAGSDRHFTNGVSLSWIDDSFGDVNETKANSYSDFVYGVADTLSFGILDGSKQHYAGISLSQIMITPSDISIATPQYNDIPYAGYLYLSSYLFESDQRSFKEFRMEFGVVGKESGAELAQKTVHNIIGSTEPKGWDTQLGTQCTINALFRYGEINWEYNSVGGLSMDWFNHFGFQLGNFTTDAFGGTMFRIGHNYVKNFNLHYPYLKEEASMLRLDKKHSGLGWSLSAGMNGELLAYSYILDEAKKDGYNLDKRPINVSIYLGADIYYDAHKITLFYQSQSPYTYEQNRIDTFGGLLYAFQF